MPELLATSAARWCSQPQSWHHLLSTESAAVLGGLSRLLSNHAIWFSVNIQDGTDAHQTSRYGFFMSSSRVASWPGCSALVARFVPLVAIRCCSRLSLGLASASCRPFAVQLSSRVLSFFVPHSGSAFSVLLFCSPALLPTFIGRQVPSATCHWLPAVLD